MEINIVIGAEYVGLALTGSPSSVFTIQDLGCQGNLSLSGKALGLLSCELSLCV